MSRTVRRSGAGLIARVPRPEIIGSMKWTARLFDSIGQMPGKTRFIREGMPACSVNL